jgi:hypothetical protein
MDKNAGIDMAGKVGRVVSADIKVSPQLVPTSHTSAYEPEVEEFKERQTTCRAGSWPIQVKAAFGSRNETVRQAVRV